MKKLGFTKKCFSCFRPSSPSKNKIFLRNEIIKAGEIRFTLRYGMRHEYQFTKDISSPTIPRERDKVGHDRKGVYGGDERRC